MGIRKAESAGRDKERKTRKKEEKKGAVINGVSSGNE